MRVLMISGDEKLLDQHSSVYARVKKYAKKLEWLHAIVPSRKNLEYIRDENFLVLPAFSLGPFERLKTAYYFATGQKKLEFKPTLVTAQDPFELGFVGWRVARHYNVPLELQIHTDIFSPYFFSHSLKNRIRVRVARFLLPRAHGIRVVSKRIEDSLRREIPSLVARITVVPVAVTLERKTASSNHNDTKTILAISRLTKEKDIPTILKAFKELRSSLTKVSLVILGDGSERRALENLARKLAISDAVSFVGWHDDIDRYLGQADVFVQTSLYEGYGRTILEAASYGVPLISTEVGVVGFELSTTSLIAVPTNDSKKLAEALYRQLTHPIVPAKPHLYSEKETVERIQKAWEGIS
ncbi:MAG: glycosyltransferase [bacterium]|nr:glycosyltransferase [bacterium]